MLKVIPFLLISQVKVAFLLGSTSNNSTFAVVQSIVLLNYSCLRKQEECDINKRSSSPPRQNKNKPKLLFVLLGSNKTWKNFTSDFNLPLINPVWLSAKDTQKNTGGRISGEKQSRVKFSAAEERREGRRGGSSTRPCRLGQSWAETSKGWLFSWRGGGGRGY